MSQRLARLDVGSEIPYKLDTDGAPQWLLVTKILSEASCEVRYPDGSLQVLKDSE